MAIKSRFAPGKNLRSLRSGSTIPIVIRAIALGTLLLSGCLFWDSTVSERVACLNLCSCTSSNSISEDQCNSECNESFEQIVLPQECLDCIGLSSCDEFDDLDNACDVECGGPVSRIVEDFE